MKRLFLLLLLAGCSSTTTAPPATSDAGTLDSGTDAPATGSACTFNRDCAAADRCACDETKGCFCETGARGTGKSGVDACTTGNDCASAVCVEDNRGGFTCSGECTTNAQCGPQLPSCASVAMLGRICIRTADGG